MLKLMVSPNAKLSELRQTRYLNLMPFLEVYKVEQHVNAERGLQLATL